MTSIFNLELYLRCPHCGEQLQGFNFENWSVDPLCVTYFGIECNMCRKKYIVNFDLIEIETEDIHDG